MTGWAFYQHWKAAQYDASESTTPVNFSSATLRLMVLTSSYTPDLVNNKFRSDIVANEVSGTGYTSRGYALSGFTTTINTSTGVVTFNLSDVTVAQNAAGFANGFQMVIYSDTGTDTTSPLICQFSPGSTFGNTVAGFTVQINANTWFTVT
jgi:hypothetical protein